MQHIDRFRRIFTYKNWRGWLVIGLIVLVVLVLFLVFGRPQKIEINVVANRSAPDLFLVIVEADTVDDGQTQRVAVHKAPVKSNSPTELRLNAIPAHTQGLQLWVVHPQYRHSRYKLVDGSGGMHRIAPISWQTALHSGMVEADEVVQHLRRIRLEYLKLLSTDERRAMLRSIDLLNKLVSAASNDIAQKTGQGAAAEQARHLLEREYNQLVMAIND
ncbi:MAG TPA: hypothetical protein VIM41_05590 [Gammaproteobacteria bacterium]